VDADGAGDVLPHQTRALAARPSPSPSLCKFRTLGTLSLRDVARERHHVFSLSMTPRRRAKDHRSDVGARSNRRKDDMRNFAWDLSFAVGGNANFFVKTFSLSAWCVRGGSGVDPQ